MLLCNHIKFNYMSIMSSKLLKKNICLKYVSATNSFPFVHLWYFSGWIISFCFLFAWLVFFGVVVLKVPGTFEHHKKLKENRKMQTYIMIEIRFLTWDVEKSRKWIVFLCTWKLLVTITMEFIKHQRPSWNSRSDFYKIKLVKSNDTLSFHCSLYSYF